MQTLQLGPLALPISPLFLALAVMLASWVADRLLPVAVPAGLDAPRPARPGDLILQATLLGLVAARLAHLALHHQAYLADPSWAIVDVRDGGWLASAGFAVGLAWLAWRGWRRPAWWRALALATLAGLALWTFGRVLALPPQGEARELPTLAVQPLDGGAPVDLRSLAQGRPLVLNLWATWCPPCRREMPVLARAQQDHPGVSFVFADQGETAPAVQAYLTEQDLALRQVMLDPASRLGGLVGSSGLPTTVVYDAQGREVDRHLGALNAAALAVMLERATQASPR
ncbi:MAG: hypothetical protein RL722_2841 [Pseudomonadota bacterium]|jgi:thiol-disulfide isomerase/thioredoxin